MVVIIMTFWTSKAYKWCFWNNWNTATVPWCNQTTKSYHRGSPWRLGAYVHPSSWKCGRWRSPWNGKFKHHQRKTYQGKGPPTKKWWLYLLGFVAEPACLVWPGWPWGTVHLDNTGLWSIFYELCYNDHVNLFFWSGSVTCVFWFHSHSSCYCRGSGQNCRTNNHCESLIGPSWDNTRILPWWAGDTASTWCGADSAWHRSASCGTTPRCTCTPPWRQETTLKGMMQLYISSLLLLNIARYIVAYGSTEVHCRLGSFFIPGTKRIVS